jgi:hypothetical protein
MRSFQIFCYGFVLRQYPFHTRSQTEQIIALIIDPPNLIQPFFHRFKLLIPTQASPGERFSTAAVYRIADSLPDLGLNPDQHWISGDFPVTRGENPVCPEYSWEPWAVLLDPDACPCVIHHRNPGYHPQDCSKMHLATLMRYLRPTSFECSDQGVFTIR